MKCHMKQDGVLFQPRDLFLKDVFDDYGILNWKEKNQQTIERDEILLLLQKLSEYANEHFGTSKNLEATIIYCRLESELDIYLCYLFQIDKIYFHKHTNLPKQMKIKYKIPLGRPQMKILKKLDTSYNSIILWKTILKLQ